jgi:hypothetical protein
MRLVNSDMTLANAKIENIVGVLGRKKHKTTEALSTIEVVNLLNVNSDRLVDAFNHLRNEKQAVEAELQEAKVGLVSAATALARVLEITDIAFNKLSIQELVLQLQILVDDLTGPGKNKHFFPILDLNELTKPMRKACKLKPSIDPAQYIPLLSAKCIGFRRAVAFAKEFATPLAVIFKFFDFQPESFEPTSEAFGILREQMFHMHGLIGKLSDRNINKTIVTVIKHLVSLSSAFLSSFASDSFERLASLEPQLDDLEATKRHSSKSKKSPKKA